ncbi:MAG TPA: 4a-hydroxytetrahydrobiopterin dehydratase [Xanthomonadaceae bacterium]|nr:4a-hydroxytetrahydrobiopterin dehydratase [Xanthomonadaceae bacterium]
MSDLIPLAQAHCIPRKGSEHKLGEARIRELLPELPGWEVSVDPASKQGHALTKTFLFKDYYRTMSFVNALAHMANREDHHPDLGVHYDRVVVRYSTHDVGGLSENDFICAAKADALAA